MVTTLVRKQRIHLLDTWRGVLVLSMVIYHGTWDLVYLFGVPQPWFTGGVGYWHQLITCSSFIFLSGYCVSLSRHLWRRGALVFAVGGLITMVTMVFAPSNQVVFGILTLMGSSMLLTAAVRPLLNAIQPLVGIPVCAVVFLLLRHLSQGVIVFGNWTLLSVPTAWYHSYFTAYLGFPFPSFFSTDYFPLLPWLPLYWMGYFVSCLQLTLPMGEPLSITAPLRFVGRHALELYVLHQPIVYVLLWLVFYF